MIAGVWVWRGIELDIYPQVSLCGKCEAKKGCERESGPAGETRMRRRGETCREEGGAGRWMDRLREFMASALKINYRLTLIFPFLFSSFTPATIHTAALYALGKNSACNPLKTLTHNRLCLARLFSPKWPRRKMCPKSFPSGRSDVENSAEMSWAVCPFNAVRRKHKSKQYFTRKQSNGLEAWRHWSYQAIVDIHCVLSRHWLLQSFFSPNLGNTIMTKLLHWPVGLMQE